MAIEEMKLKDILELDVKSDEFFNIYKKVSGKYWTFDNPSDYQKAAATLVMFAERAEWEKVTMCITLATELMKMSKDPKNDGKKSGSGHVLINNQEFWFDIYQNEDAKDELHKNINKIGKAVKKGQFGKKYF